MSPSTGTNLLPIPKQPNTISVLFFGDVVGKIGRQALAKAVPQYRDAYQPDVIICNAENSAHGSGVTTTTLQDLRDVGVDYCTSGNHTFAKAEAFDLLTAPQPRLIKPHNDSRLPHVPGYVIVPCGSLRLAIMNLIGQVYMTGPYSNPFLAFDALVAGPLSKEHCDLIFVDFHAEATSEKVCFGYHVDGRAHMVVGTHTHIATADARILPSGTAYVTDAGMVGATHSSLGMSLEGIIPVFLEQIPKKITSIPESGEVTVNAVLMTYDVGTKKMSIDRVDTAVII